MSTSALSLCHCVPLPLRAVHIKNLITHIRYAGFDHNRSHPFCSLLCSFHAPIAQLWVTAKSHFQKRLENSLFSPSDSSLCWGLRAVVPRWRRWTDKIRWVPQNGRQQPPPSDLLITSFSFRHSLFPLLSDGISSLILLMMSGTLEPTFYHWPSPSQAQSLGLKGGCDQGELLLIIADCITFLSFQLHTQSRASYTLPLQGTAKEKTVMSQAIALTSKAVCLLCPYHALWYTMVLPEMLSFLVFKKWFKVGSASIIIFPLLLNYM